MGNGESRPRCIDVTDVPIGDLEETLASLGPTAAVRLKVVESADVAARVRREIHDPTLWGIWRTRLAIADACRSARGHDLGLVSVGLEKYAAHIESKYAELLRTQGVDELGLVVESHLARELPALPNGISGFLVEPSDPIEEVVQIETPPRRHKTIITFGNSMVVSRQNIQGFFEQEDSLILPRVTRSPLDSSITSLRPSLRTLFEASLSTENPGFLLSNPISAYTINRGVVQDTFRILREESESAFEEHSALTTCLDTEDARVSEAEARKAAARHARPRLPPHPTPDRRASRGPRVRRTWGRYPITHGRQSWQRRQPRDSKR